MNSILVVCDHTLNLDRMHAELSRLVANERADAFLLVCHFGPAPLRRLAQLRRRYWTATNRRLDIAVDRLTTEGWIADGMLSGQAPAVAIAEALRTHAPTMIVASAGLRAQRRHRVEIETALAERATAGDELGRVTWLSR